MSTNKSIWLIIPAAGQGKRFSQQKPKQYHQLLGKTLLEQTLDRFSQRFDIKGIVLVVANDDDYIKQLHLPDKVQVVVGGAQRVDSVKAGLAFLQGKAKADDLVAVHDAARPCVRQDMLNTLFTVAEEEQYGVVPALIARETVKKVKQNKISKTLRREHIALAQTPQVFPFWLLSDCIYKAGAVTDEASCVEQAGFSPTVIDGDPFNIKVTVVEDLVIAKACLEHILQEEKLCE